MRIRYAFLFICSLISLSAKAQFYTDGTDPASVRWNSISGQTYKVIYPRGLDSLAREYAMMLESYYPAVRNSIGTDYTRRRPLPVILHSYNASPNGMVTWIPRRMELITMPQAYAPLASPWQEHLIIHESRHVFQTAFGEGKPYRWANILLGQMAPAAISAVLGGQPFLEGDAVVAETALTQSGRGRNADFTEYARVSFGEGDYRDYWKWRVGSTRKYTPSYYMAGYLLVGGTRAYYDAPDFTKRFYERIAEHKGIAPFNTSMVVKEYSGKNLKKTFRDISHRLQEEWAADDSLRAPFMPAERIEAIPRYYTDNSSIAITPESIFIVRNGLTRPSEIIEIGGDGNKISRSTFGPVHSGIKYNPEDGLLYWSEHSKDPRWEHASYSDIRVSQGTGTKRTLTHKHRYYNPSPAGNGLLAVTEYLDNGKSAVVMISTADGSVCGSFNAPDGMQVVETACIDGKVYASAITDEGYGIYEADGWKKILQAGFTTVKDLWQHEGKIMFTCDLTGVNELYSLDPEERETIQVTTSRYGASSYRYSSNADTLYYSSLLPQGRLLYRTASKDLPKKKADFTLKHSWPIAETLTRDEKQQRQASAERREVTLGESRKYVKAAHLLRFHSWAPLYINQDVIANASFENILTSAGLGATAFFQNDLSSSYGMVGYKYDLQSKRHSGHIKYTYAGWYPVIEASLDVNDRAAYGYLVEDKGDNRYAMKRTLRDNPVFISSLNTYIPLSWNRSGWSSGFIPRVRASFTNDEFRDRTMSKLFFSANGYIVRNGSTSRIYPKFGAGAQMGYAIRPWVMPFMCSSMYANAYIYLPGVWETHGLRLSGLYSRRFDDGVFCEAIANMAPRGFQSTASDAMAAYPHQSKLSIDYVMPFAAVDWSFMSPIAYIKHFELTLHGDYSNFWNSKTRGNLYSVGADLCVTLGKLLFIPYNTRIGVSYNYNGGRDFQSFFPYSNGPHSFDLIFSVAM